MEKLAEYVVALRRHFHTYPEVAGQELKTQEKIVSELAAIGLKAQKMAGTGVVAEITGGLPGKRMAVRADIDALPVQDECGQPYQSQNPGVCHACGHDGHAAMLLGVAKVLQARRAQLAGSVRLIFQPHEELPPGGAKPMIEAGVLDGVDAIIGAHLWQPIEVGKLGISYGHMMAEPGSFSITVKGKGGHGSMPHQAVDSILVSAQIIQALHAIVSRNVDPLDTAVLSIGVFKAGQIRNIIPDTARMEGTVRVFDHDLLMKILDRIDRIVKGICEGQGAEYVFETIFSYPAVTNNPAITQFIREAGEEVLGKDGVAEIKPVLAAEDYSHYLQKVPGALMFVGCGNAAAGKNYPHHHPKFDIDETALTYGVEIMVRTVINYLKGPA